MIVNIDSRVGRLLPEICTLGNIFMHFEENKIAIVTKQSELTDTESWRKLRG